MLNDIDIMVARNLAASSRRFGVPCCSRNIYSCQLFVSGVAFLLLIIFSSVIVFILWWWFGSGVSSGARDRGSGGGVFQFFYYGG